MSNSGKQWSTQRYSIQDTNPSFNYKCVHHYILTKLPNHCGQIVTYSHHGLFTGKRRIEWIVQRSSFFLRIFSSNSMPLRATYSASLSIIILISPFGCSTLSKSSRLNNRVAADSAVGLVAFSMHDGAIDSELVLSSLLDSLKQKIKMDFIFL